MMQEIKELQTINMVRFFGSRNDFAAGTRGTRRMWREGDTVYIEGEERTIAMPWTQVAAVEMAPGPRRASADPVEDAAPSPKRRGRPRKNEATA